MGERGKMYLQNMYKVYNYGYQEKEFLFKSSVYIMQTVRFQHTTLSLTVFLVLDKNR